MRQSKKRLTLRRALLWALALAVLLETAMLAAVIINARRKNSPQPADTLIVLGARVNPDGSPSPALQRRLDLALSLYAQGYAPHIITTGAQGHDEPLPEGAGMRDYLLSLGMPEDAVTAECDSYNTRENLANAQALMTKAGMRTAIIVTSDYHLWRALSMCDAIGLHATGAGSQNALTFPVALRNCLQETLSWYKYILTR